jgi:membrane-associated phospholipid phosphatase
VIFWPAVAIAYAKKRTLQRLVARGPKRVARIADVMGSGQAMFAYWVVLAITAARTGDPKLRVFVREFAKSGALGFVIFESSRFALAERRPKEGGEMRFFAGRGHGVSGHTFAAALLHGPIMSAWGPSLSRRNRALLSASLYAWVALIAWSRVRLDEHYVWNVMLGARIGLRVSGASARRLRVGRRPRRHAP